MKNITKNEIKVYLLGLVATVMTINSVATLSKNSYKLFLDKECEIIEENNFNNLYSILSRYAYNKHASLVRVNDETYIISMKDSNTVIKIVQNQVRISTLYRDDFFEVHFRDSLGFDVDYLEKCISHKVVPKVIKKEIEEVDILEKSQAIVANSMMTEELTEEQVIEINDITEHLLTLFSKYSDISYSEKEEIIKCGFKITQDQLDVFVPVCIREGNYIDCVAVTVNVLNRQFSYGWTQQAITNMGLDKNFDEVTIFDLISSEGQYQVYDEKTYLYAYGDKSSDAYKAVIDTLYACLMGDEEIYRFHDYVEFVAPTLTPNGGYTPEQFVKNGNKHYRHQKKSDRIPVEESTLKDFYAVYNILESEGILEEAMNSEDNNSLSLSIN